MIMSSKKNSYPFFNENKRLDIIKSIKYVYYAEIVNNDVITNKLLDHDLYKYDVLFSCDDWKGSEYYKQYECELSCINVDVVYFPYTKNISSTEINEYITMKYYSN